MSSIEHLPRFHERNLLITILAAAAIFITLDTLVAAAQIEFWRHDDLAYLYGFEVKLREDGRWMIYILYPHLRALHGHLLWAFNLICYAGFVAMLAFRISENLAHKNRLFFVLPLALCLGLLPAFFDQNMWPASLVPGFATLFAMSLLMNRRNSFVTLPLFTIVLFGSLQSFAVFPLLFATLLAMGTDDGWGRRLALVVAVWLVSMPVAYLVMHYSVVLVTGSGLTIAEWRAARPLSGVGDILPNLVLAFRNALSIVSDYWYFALLLPVAAYALLTDRPDRESLLRLGALLLVALATAGFVFGIAFYTGSPIIQRTEAPALIGLLCALVLVAGRMPVATGIVLAAFSVLIAIRSNELVASYSRASQEIHETFRQALDGVALPGDLIVVDYRELESFGQRFSDRSWNVRRIGIYPFSTQPYRMSQAIVALGFQDRLMCPWNLNAEAEPACARFVPEEVRDCAGRPLCAERLDARTVLVTLN